MKKEKHEKHEKIVSLLNSLTIGWVYEVCYLNKQCVG